MTDPVPPNTIWQEATATGYWTSSNPLITFTNATSFNTSAGIISPQTQAAFIWHSVNNFTDYVSGIAVPACELTDTMLVYNNSVTATAGADKVVCGIEFMSNSFTINAVPVLAPLTGLWTQISGPASNISTPASNTTLVTNVTQDNTYIYQWTVSSTVNGRTCTASDNMQVQVRIPTTSVVNPNTIEVCVNQAPLVANIPISGVGTWSSASGSPGTINNPSSNVTFVDLVQNGISQWQWTINRLGCTSTDLITVTNNTVTADADIALVNPNTVNICVPEYTLNATDPGIFNVALPDATGLWTKNLGLTTFDNVTVYNTTVRNLSSALPNILTWTITKGSCIASNQIFINNNQFTTDAHTVNVPNIDETCNGNFTLAGQAPPAGGSGFWSINIGGGTFVNPTVYNTLVTGISAPSSVYQWNVTSNGCNAFSTVTINNNQVFSNAGFDQTVCSDYIEFPIIANQYWTYLSGCRSITENTTTNVWEVDLCQGENELELTVTNGICTLQHRILL